jgi:hypothetical protein
MTTDGAAMGGPGVVFLHIPKTAGMTFREILVSRYSKQFHYCMDPALPGIEAALEGYRCVELHSLTTATDWYIIHAELVRQNRLDLLEGKQVFTMFRDPVDFYLSSFYYLQSIREIAEPPMKLQGLPFPESLEELMQHPASFNEQLAFFVGKSQRTGVCVDRDDLEKAKEMLVRLKMHVGLAERFAESMHLFEQLTGQAIPGRMIRTINRNPSRPSLAEVPDAIKERIRQGSALDGELYDFGRDLFLAELERCGPAPEYRLVEQAEQTGELLSATPAGTHPRPTAAPVVAAESRFGAWARSMSRLWNAPRS